MYMKQITSKQKQIYDFIIKSSKKNGASPSLEDIANHFSTFLKYPSSAHYHIKKLQEAGYLKRELNKHRSIGVHKNDFIESPVFLKSHSDSVSIPLMGSANAGTATIFTEDTAQGYLKISRNILSKRDGIFALRVDGDSMNKASINGRKFEDGDFVLIDSEYRDPKSGDYVLSVIDGMANLKKFDIDKKTKTIRLLSESTNKKHKPIYISSADDYMINGKIISVIKK